MKFLDKTMHKIFMLSAFSSLCILFFIAFYLFRRGLPAVMETGIRNFLFGSVWQPFANAFGIFPMLAGTVAITLGAIALSFPIGVMTALFLLEIVPRCVKVWVQGLIDILAWIPSVVFGFFGVAVVVPQVAQMKGAGNSVLAAVLLLALMLFPTIVSLSLSEMEAVSRQVRFGSYALGETELLTAFRLVLPASKKGLLSALVLAVGRAAGEATAVILVAGNTVQVPHSLFDAVRTLSANCAIEMGYASGVHADMLYATGAVLFVVVMLLNLWVMHIEKGGGHEAD